MTEEKQKYFHIYRDVKFLGDSTYLHEVEPVKDGNYETAYSAVKERVDVRTMEWLRKHPEWR